MAGDAKRDGRLAPHNERAVGAGIRHDGVTDKVHDGSPGCRENSGPGGETGQQNAILVDPACLTKLIDEARHAVLVDEHGASLFARNCPCAAIAHDIVKR